MGGLRRSWYTRACTRKVEFGRSWLGRGCARVAGGKLAPDVKRDPRAESISF